MLAGRRARPCIPSVMRQASSMSTRGTTVTPKGRPILSARSYRMPGASMICWGTFANGALIGMTRNTMHRRRLLTRRVLPWASLGPGHPGRWLVLRRQDCRPASRGRRSAGVPVHTTWVPRGRIPGMSRKRSHRAKRAAATYLVLRGLTSQRCLEQKGGPKTGT